MLTSAGIEDGDVGELVQLVELNISLSLFAIMIYLHCKKQTKKPSI